MIRGILEHTPFWVWVVFGSIVLLGLQQTRTRDVSIARATILPLVMIVLSLSGVLGTFARVPLAWAAWGAGLTLTLRFAGNVVAARGAVRSARPGHLRVPGSLIPIALIRAANWLIRYFRGPSCGHLSGHLTVRPALCTLKSPLN